MELLEKLSILADAAKYDVACTSSGSERKNTSSDMLGNAVKGGICHSFTSDGRCISLLKVLFSNNCAYDCEYCVNRRTNDIKRAAFTPEEIAYLTIEFYKRNFIEGLFLSSAVIRDPDHTMELIIKAVKMLRRNLLFNGYIHVKAIPGTDEKLLDEAGCLVDRMSVNVELPSKKSLRLLAPDKKPEDVVRPMGMIRDKIREAANSSVRRYVPAGQSTQLIVGATRETDRDILGLSEELYGRFRLKRVFYSAYIPIFHNTLLPQIQGPELKREHRLYQADWLIRFYGFKAAELLDKERPNLNMELDPKCEWALRNLMFFPVEVNTAGYEELLRVPGIGVTSARRIIQARRTHSLDFENLTRMRIVMKRARFFITCRGKTFEGLDIGRANIRSILMLAEKPLITGPGILQLSLFDDDAVCANGGL